MYRHFFKRFLDFIGALLALVLLAPFLLIVIIWLHFANHGAGVFFTQERPGRNAKIF
ncbi:MAG: sugar transferase, partial [Alistipes sp.]